MIKNNGIRSGNYFHNTKTGKTVALTFTISHHVAGQIGLSDLKVSGVDSLQPIPISEEWISKAGVKKDEHNQYHFDGYYLHHHHSGSWSVFNHTTPHPLTELNFVHEWQNWHYALNKKELVFN